MLPWNCQIVSLWFGWNLLKFGFTCFFPIILSVLGYCVSHNVPVPRVVLQGSFLGLLVLFIVFYTLSDYIVRLNDAKMY